MNRLILYLLPVILMIGSEAKAQKFLTRTGQVTFEASTPLEKIYAVHNQVAGILDLSSGEVIFEVLIKGFQFEKALMQEHFNENYMESDRFPKASFTGRLDEEQISLLKQDGSKDLQVKGTLFMHGVRKKIQVTVTISEATGGLEAKTAFTVRPEDFGIEIPNLVRSKIAETVQVRFQAKMKAR